MNCSNSLVPLEQPSSRSMTGPYTMPRPCSAWHWRPGPWANRPRAVAAHKETGQSRFLVARPGLAGRNPAYPARQLHTMNCEEVLIIYLLHQGAIHDNPTIQNEYIAAIAVNGWWKDTRRRQSHAVCMWCL